ncbi:hypothetical protein Trydic_g16576 [Trypoxylus dichotomus]
MSTSWSNASVSSIDKWVKNLADININELHPKINCEFLMAVEESPFFTKMIKMIEFYSLILTEGKLITVSFKDIYELHLNSRIKQPYWDDNFYEIITAASTEADLYVHIDQPIPVDLLEAMLRENKNYYKPVMVEVEGKGKGKGKGKDKTKAEKSNAKPKKGKKEEGNLEENLCAADQYVATEEILPDPTIDIPVEDDLSKENLDLNNYIPVQKAIHEIQAAIPNRGNKKASLCIDQTNPSERVNPFDFKWVDRLPALVALQELAKASDEYEFVDWRYVELFDSMLYRFHHDVDDFGIATRFWKETVRSPVSFNNFMTYVLHNEYDTITEQSEKYNDNEMLYKYVKQTIDNLSDFSVHSEDFILPGSLKDKYLHTVSTDFDLNEDKSRKGKQQKGKTDKDSPKSKKTTSEKANKTAKNLDTLNPRAVIEDEPLHADLANLKVDRSLIPDNPPDKINAIDFNGLLLTTSGISTSFYSLDDLKVIVNQTQICDEATMLSAKVTLNHHDLVVHRQSKGDFSFLVNFKSGAILVCGRPKSCSSKTDMDLYLMTEESENIVNCMRSLFNTEKNILIDDKKFKKAVKCLKRDLQKGVVPSSGTETPAKSSYRNSKATVLSRPRSSSTKQYSTPQLLKRRETESKPLVSDIGRFSVKGITLPSGLHLRNIVGEKGTYICQHYFQKQAICSSIFDEDCRLFLGNGTIAVRKDNGAFIIYAANGEIIKYETLFVGNSSGSKFYGDTNSVNTMPRFLKHIRRSIYKLTREHQQRNDFMSSRRIWKKEVKRFKCGKQKHAFSNIKFSFTTSNGNVILYENGTLTERDAYYVEKEDALRTGHVTFRREDGTISVLTDEGHMQTVFSDGTKITVWCEIDSKPVTVDLADIPGYEWGETEPFLKVITCYQYEHPYYITLLSNGPDEKLMLRMASGEIFDISSKHFLVGIDEWSTLLANKEIVRFVGTPCDSCGKYCECDVYIKQLYDPPPVIDNKKLLLKVSDTYNKYFLLHYDGSIERNEEYIRERKCNHASHKIQSPQAFFSLNRDFSGCLFWTNDNYNKRLSEAADPETEYVVFYVDKTKEKILTTEWKTFAKLHHNLRFVWPEVKTASDEEIEEYDISSAAFVKQRIVKRIPGNVVMNLASIIDQNIDIFSPSKLLNMKNSASKKSMSLATSDNDSDIQDIRTKKKLAYEKKMKNRDIECTAVVDKIIEYFVKKTGRYYRSKVYEDFCGVKLMLDEEEEIFFLANFDTTTHTSSASESVSDSSGDINKTKNLSKSMEIIKSKLSKSTSAVEIAVEVIKQLEIEKEKGCLHQSDQPYTVIKPSATQDTATTFKPRVIPMDNFNDYVHYSSEQDVSPRYIHIVCSLDKNNVNQKASTTYQAKVMPSILKTPRVVDDFVLNQSNISIFEDVTKANKLNDQPETQPQTKFEKHEATESNKSLEYLGESMDNENIEETLRAISRALKRIRREKFNYYKGSNGEDSRTESGSCIKIFDDKGGKRSSDSPVITRPKCQKDVKLSVVQDLFCVPRQKPELYDSSSDSQLSIKAITKDRTSVDKCYSNFSFKNVGMADYLPESKTGCGDDDIDEVFVREHEDQNPQFIPRIESKNILKNVVDEEKTCKLLQVMTTEHDCLKIIHESMSSGISEASSINKPLDMENNYILENTPSMIPLINIKSLARYQSDINLPLMSVVSFVTGQGRTSSMKVLRSMSQIEKDFEVTIVQNSGIVTDKNTTREVQTDIVYEESDENFWD